MNSCCKSKIPNNREHEDSNNNELKNPEEMAVTINISTATQCLVTFSCLVNYHERLLNVNGHKHYNRHKYFNISI